MEKILNVPNAQRALSIVRRQLNEINITKSELFNDIEFYYTLADKYTKDGKRFFQLLNESKDSLRSLRNEENSLILMNKLLKKFISENREEFSKESSGNKNIINYLPTVYEFDKMSEKDDVLVNKLFPTVSYKDVKRWFKNNPDKEYIELFEVQFSNNFTRITDHFKLYKDSLKYFQEHIELHNYIFTADCFKTRYSEFIGAGHRKEYVQKCIDLYGSVICNYKDKINYTGTEHMTTNINNIEDGKFQGKFFDWKYVEVALENFR